MLDPTPPPLRLTSLSLPAHIAPDANTAPALGDCKLYLVRHGSAAMSCATVWHSQIDGSSPRQTKTGNQLSRDEAMNAFGRPRIAASVADVIAG